MWQQYFEAIRGVRYDHSVASHGEDDRREVDGVERQRHVMEAEGEAMEREEGLRNVDGDENIRTIEAVCPFARVANSPPKMGSFRGACRGEDEGELGGRTASFAENGLHSKPDGGGDGVVDRGEELLASRAGCGCLTKSFCRCPPDMGRIDRGRKALRETRNPRAEGSNQRQGGEGR